MVKILKSFHQNFFTHQPNTAKSELAPSWPSRRGVRSAGGLSLVARSSPGARPRADELIGWLWAPGLRPCLFPVVFFRPYHIKKILPFKSIK